MSESRRPAIPNLLETLRSSRGGRAGRSARGARDQNVSLPLSSDLIVQQTDDDAAGSRLSAVLAGYLQDHYAALFVASETSQRRMPIINRGTYVRTAAIDALVKQFMHTNAVASNLQIISLGAGSDTRYFRLLEDNKSPRRRLMYHELDFAATTTKKISTIEKSPQILSLLQLGDGDADDDIQISIDKTNLRCGSYHIHDVDLRKLADVIKPALSGVDQSAPTLILSEMCLTYLEPRISTAILRYLLNDMMAPASHVEIVLYEPLKPEDAFGRTMLRNLSSRGITLAGLEGLPTLDSHAQRLSDAGCREIDTWSVKQWWDTCVSSSEKARLRACEMVDEEEEWNLLAEHYGFIRGRRIAS